VLHLGSAASAVACLPAPLALCLLMGFVLLLDGCRSGYWPLVSRMLDSSIGVLISSTVLYQLR